jgi:hypothetical protein
VNRTPAAEEEVQMPGRPLGQPTVYLHIGIAKTGTTYLQELLWHNRKVLERHGVRYPAQLPGDHFRAAVDLRQTPFAGDHATFVPGTWDTVAAAAMAAPDRAVISHETLTRTRVEQVRRAAESFAGADLHLIVTVRDLGRQLPAVWQEQVKNRSAISYARFLRAVAETPKSRRHRHFWMAQDVLDVLARWSTAVPPERIHVVTVPQPGAESGLLWQRFASVIGLDPSVVETDVPMSNVSLGVAEAELLRRMNRSLRHRMDWPTYEREVKVGLAKRLAARRDSTRLTVPKNRRAWVEQCAEGMIAGLRSGGYDVVGNLDELRPVFDERPVVMPSDIRPQQLLRMAGDVVGELVVDNAARRSSGLRGRLAALNPATRLGRSVRRFGRRRQQGRG